jgi:hypothetical protein
MGGKRGDVVDIDNPNYWRFDFSTEEDNTVVSFGFFCFSNPETKDLHLDGVKISRYSGHSIKVPIAGEHTLYANISQPYSNTSYNMSIKPYVETSYVRIPTGWEARINYKKGGTIPLVDLLTPEIALAKSTQETLRIDVLRVPIETNIADIHSGWLSVANKIIKVKYNFIS